MGGRVPIFMNFHLPVGCDLLGKTSFYGKLVDNFFECKEIQPVYGSFYTPKMAEGTIWIQLTPRKRFLLDEAPEEIGKIIDVIFSSYKDKKSVNQTSFMGINTICWIVIVKMKSWKKLLSRFST